MNKKTIKAEDLKQYLKCSLINSFDGIRRNIATGNKTIKNEYYGRITTILQIMNSYNLITDTEYDKLLDITINYSVYGCAIHHKMEVE